MTSILKNVVNEQLASLSSKLKLDNLKLGNRSVLGIPYLWLIIFFAFPFLILLRISLTDMGDGIDPFAQMLFNTDGKWRLILKVENYLSVFREEPGSPWLNTIYVEAYWLSLRYAFLTTILCLFIGYPFAYFIARANPAHRPIYLILIMLPFWTSFLLRVYAWKGILADQGVVNRALMAIGVIDEPIAMLYTDVSMLVGMTYVYLPFMVLPLYANLVKMDLRLLEAAHDLGAGPWKAFWLITVPLSRTGIVAGCMLVFIPCVGEFVIPSLLGGADNIMIGRVVWDEMFSANNWPRASALAVIMIVVVIAPLLWFQNSVTNTPHEEGSKR
jgi:putrescine transport system permease protein